MASFLVSISLLLSILNGINAQIQPGYYDLENDIPSDYGYVFGCSSDGSCNIVPTQYIPGSPEQNEVTLQLELKGENWFLLANNGASILDIRPFSFPNCSRCIFANDEVTYASTQAAWNVDYLGYSYPGFGVVYGDLVVLFHPSSGGSIWM